MPLHTVSQVCSHSHQGEKRIIRTQAQSSEHLRPWALSQEEVILKGPEGISGRAAAPCTPRTASATPTMCGVGIHLSLDSRRRFQIASLTVDGACKGGASHIKLLLFNTSHCLHCP